jgi:hypothetical protein
VPPGPRPALRRRRFGATPDVGRAAGWWQCHHDLPRRGAVTFARHHRFTSAWRRDNGCIDSDAATRDLAHALRVEEHAITGWRDATTLEGTTVTAFATLRLRYVICCAADCGWLMIVVLMCLTWVTLTLRM